MLHCSRTEPLLIADCVFSYLGTGGRAQLCNSPVAWLPMALLLCRGHGAWCEPCHVLGQPENGEERSVSPSEVQTSASSQHLESLCFMWEIWGASDRPSVFTVPKPVQQRCLSGKLCVCLSSGSLMNKIIKNPNPNVVWIHFQQTGEHVYTRFAHKQTRTKREQDSSMLTVSSLQLSRVLK